MNTQPAPENPEYTFDTVQLMGVFDQIIRDSSWHLFARFLTRQLNTGNLELKNLKTILERVANTPNLDKDPAMQDMSKKCVAAIVGYFNSNFNELFQISSDNIE